MTDPSISRRLTAYRQVREEVERAVAALATSVDGLTFELQASLHDLTLRRGGYVSLRSQGGALLGQITDLRADAETTAVDGTTGAGASIRIRVAKGSGIVLDREAPPFHDARVTPADPSEVGAWFAASRRPGHAGLVVGELFSAPGVPAILDSGGLDRHTFLCGQSGSGKTYSLGLLLERILAETSLRVVVLDPNSDYVGLGELRPGADAPLAARYAHVPADVAVWRGQEDAEHPLRLRFRDLEPAAQAAVLGLHPIQDRDEYAVLADLLRLQEDGQPLVRDVGQLVRAETRAARDLGLRAQNLGVLDWHLWDPEQPSLVDEIRSGTTRCTVVDLGSLDTVQEQQVVAGAVLSALWETRLTKQPCLVVVDEAHNVCPTEPQDELTRLTTERAVQIAAEGRKYGLYLLTSTQRPHKVHENVVSQCDNLLLMRMNSDADLADLARLFSFVPPGLMAGATSFRMGQALVAGKLLPQAAYVRMGERITVEGGSDVPATWAVARP